jgi:galactokinase
MKAVAAFFGKSVLRELTAEQVLSHAAEIRKAAGDRALLRAVHFFAENRRVDAMLAALERMNASSGTSGQAALFEYLGLVNQSGDSSWELLQNIYSPKNPREQGIAAALAITRQFIGAETPGAGACRIHGGGFAGTIQVYIPLDCLTAYTARMEGVFGPGSVTPLRIRPVGAAELRF